MRQMIGKLGIALFAALFVAGCSSNREPQLMHLRSDSAGPDEFGILPTKPLQMPDNLSELPAPTPGGSNLTDPTPEADAVAALGGSPDRVTATGKGVSAGDGALLARADRFGASGDIRETLAAEDYAYRKDHDGRLLEKLFSVNVYYKAYKPMALDQKTELERWRKLGLRTPAAPPSGAAQQAMK